MVFCSFKFTLLNVAYLCYIGKCKPLLFLTRFMNADKPPIQELHQFLEFQLPRQWAPVLGDIPLGPDRKQQSTASLQFSFMGPKLYVNTIPVILCLLCDDLYLFIFVLYIYISGQNSFFLSVVWDEFRLPTC